MRRTIIFAFALTVLATATSCFAADEAGTLIAVEGEVEVFRSARLAQSAVGSTVLVGDEIHTGADGRVRIALRDDSILNIAPSTTLLLDQHVFDPAAGTIETLLQLITGKIRALVTQYYNRSGATFQIKTPTAVSGVRGTEFVVAYDREREQTKVTGISGRVRVSAAIDPDGQAVFIAARQTTIVSKGAYPTPPQTVEDELLQQYIEDLEFIGLGGSESMLLADPYIAGTEVPLGDSGEQPKRRRSGSRSRRTAAPDNEDAPAGDRQTAGGVAGQPPTAIESLGEIEVPF